MIPTRPSRAAVGLGRIRVRLPGPRGAAATAAKSLLLGALFLSAPLPLALGAEKPGPVRETADVALVEVPVRVLGRDGNPIRGLTEGDFQVFDDGRRQEIVGFDAVDLAEKVAPGGGSPVPAPARRRFLILFDSSFAQPRSVVLARGAAREFVLEGMGAADLAAVAVYSVERGMRLLVTFTSDRAQLAHALEALGTESIPSRLDPLAFAFERPTLVLPASPDLAGSGKAGAQAALADNLQTLGSLNAARSDEYERGRVRHLIQSFRDLGQALDTVPGRKDVIYLSEGFRSRYLVGTRENDQERQWLVQGEQWKVDSDKRFGNSPLRAELSSMGELLRRSDCVIHAVDIAGIRPAGDAESGSASFAPRETENSLYEIASSAGGDVFRNANDLRAQLDSLVARTSVVYVLAFHPDRSAGEGKFHELKVKVSTPGSRASARPGYYERRGFHLSSPFERSLRAADVIANEIPVDQIAVRVLATPFASGEPAASVPVLLEVGGDGFLAGQEGARATVEIYVYASDSENRLTDFFTQAIGIDIAHSRERLQAGGIRYSGELRLGPGRYRLRALVRNADTGRMGLSVSSLLVPAFESDEPYLLAPVFLEGPGDWLTVEGRRPEAGGSVRPTDHPLLALAGRGLSPTAEARIQPGTPSSVCVVAYHFGVPGEDELRVGNQIVAFDGKPIREGTLEVLRQSKPAADGRRLILLAFTAPPDLPAGRYGLRIFLQDASGRARQAWTPFRVP